MRRCRRRSACLASGASPTGSTPASSATGLAGLLVDVTYLNNEHVICTALQAICMYDAMYACDHRPAQYRHTLSRASTDVILTAHPVDGSSGLLYRRRYEYILPAFAFDPASCQPRNAAEATASAANAVRPDSAALDSGSAASRQPAPAAQPVDGDLAEAPEAAPASLQQSRGAPQPDADPAAAAAAPRCRGAAAAAAADAAAASTSSFHFDDACRQRLSDILGRFCGTHNFHNFTIKVCMLPNMSCMLASVLSHHLDILQSHALSTGLHAEEVRCHAGAGDLAGSAALHHLLLLHRRL